jgi:hypothetical protein
MTSSLLAGLYVLQVALVNSSDYPMGQLITPDSPTPGTVYSPYVAPAPVSYAPATPTYAEAYSYARMKLRGRIPLGATDYGTGTLTFAEYDNVFDPLVMGSTRDTTTATSSVFNSANFSRNTPRKFLIGFTPASVVVDSSISYTTIWKWGYFSRGGLGANSGNGQNPNNITYTLHLVLSTRTPFGQLFSAAAAAPDNDVDTEYLTNALYPHALTTYVDDGSGTSILQAYTPYYSEHAGAYNVFYKQGVDNKASVTSLTSKTWTVSAGTSADIWNILTPSQEILTVAA